jgi:hypothetical protein
MKHQRHFGSANVVPLREMTRIGAFIGISIAAPGFSTRHCRVSWSCAKLTERRDNLLATLAVLEQRLARLRGRPDKLPA